MSNHLKDNKHKTFLILRSYTDNVCSFTPTENHADFDTLLTLYAAALYKRTVYRRVGIKY